MTKTRFIAWTIWATASVFYAYQYVLRVMPNIMLGDIMRQFDMDTALFGQFSGIYYIGYVAMLLPLGIMLDRFGPRKVMTTCILLTVAGLLPIIFTTKYSAYAILGRLLTGVGSAAAILGAFKIIRMSFPEKHFTRMLSFSVSIGLLGAIYGGAPVSYLCTNMGYKDVVSLFALAGLILAAATYFIVPEVKAESTKSIWSDIKTVITNGRVICACVFAGCMVGPLEGFADVWGAPFLQKAYGLDQTVAAGLLSMIFMGMCFGAPVLSFCAEKTDYLATIIGAGIVMALSFFALLSCTLSASIMGLLLAMIGVCCAYQIIAIYKASTYVLNHVAGLTTAITNMIIMFFGYIFHTVIGSLTQWMGGVESAEAITRSLYFIPMMLVVGSFGFVVLALWERRKPPQLNG